MLWLLMFVLEACAGFIVWFHFFHCDYVGFVCILGFWALAFIFIDRDFMYDLSFYALYLLDIVTL